MECSQKAQDEWVRTIRAAAVDNTQFLRECTPSYYNNEGEKKFRLLFRRALREGLRCL